MNWLIDSVDEGSFAALMSLAIESYSRYAYENGREELEIGYLKGNDLMYRSGKESYNKMPSFDINVSLGKKKIRTTSQKFFTSGTSLKKKQEKIRLVGTLEFMTLETSLYQEKIVLIKTISKVGVK